MTKTLVEVGVVGTLVLLAALAGLLTLVGAAALAAARARRPAPFAAALAAFAWVLLAAKVHPVLSDTMAGAAFYFFTGFAVRELDAAIEAEQPLA